MGWSKIPKPGTEIPSPATGKMIEIGPCLNESCGHHDCVELRKMAQSKCPECDKPIEYDEKYYNVTEDYPDAEGFETRLGIKMVLAHAVCMWKKVEEDIATKD